MKESTTYQAILQEGRQEGRQEEAREILIRVGKKLFKMEPSPEQRTAIEAITETTRLEDLIVQAYQVRNWAELLAPPTPPPTSRRGRGKKSS
jgi:hypothetical protein